MSSNNLDSLDCKVPRKRRVWPMVRPDCVVQPGQTFADCSEVLLFSLRCSDICRDPTAFDQFDMSRQHSQRMEQLFQLMFRSLECLVSSMRNKPAELLTNDSFPVRVYLETVLVPQDQALHEQENDYELQQKRAAAKFLTELYGTDLCTVEELMRGAHSNLRNGAFSQPHVKHIPYLRKPANSRDPRDYDQTRVYEYRFWFFITEPAVTLAGEIASVLMDSFGQYDKQFGGSSETPAARLFSKPRNGDETGDSEHKFVESVGPDERWALIKSEVDWLHTLLAYTRDRTLAQASKRNEALSQRKKINNVDNPLNPHNVFSAQQYFESIANTHHRDEAQSRLEHYTDGAEWFFPLPHCVLEVLPHFFNVNRIRHMYTPDTQKRLVEPRLDRGLRLGSSTFLDNAVDNGNDNAGDVSMTEDELASGSGCDIDLDGDLYGSQLMDINADLADETAAAELTMRREEEEDRRRRAAEAAERRAAQEAARASAGDRTNQVLPVARSELHMAQECEMYGDYSATVYADRGFHSQADRTNKTHLHTLRSDFHDMTARCIMREDDPRDRARERLLAQFRATDEYNSKCTQSCSNVTPIGRVINKWMEERSFDNPESAKHQPLRFVDTDRPYIDAALSLFATIVIQEFDDLEDCHYIYTAHAECFLVHKSLMTAYLYAFDTLRLNVIFWGEPQTSKSHPFSVHKTRMIEDTVMALTNDSALADAGDDDDNDLPRVYEELPNEMICQTDREGKKLNAYKEMLTRNVYSRRVLEIDQNGQRHQRLVRSEKHTAIGGATNKHRREFDSAIDSRHVVRHHVERSRPDCDIADKKAAEQNASAQDAKRRERSIHNDRIAQCLQFHAEKMIMVGPLVDPLLTVLSVVYPRYKKTLRDQYALHVARRIDDQVRQFTRVMVLHHAIRWLYFSPRSPFYGARQVSVWHLTALNPMLHDTEELVYFVFDQFRPSFIDPNQEAVILMIKRFVKKIYKRAGSLDKLFETPSERRRRNQRAQKKLIGSAIVASFASGKKKGPSGKAANGDNFSAADDADAADNDAEDEGIDGDHAEDHNARNYNYVVLRYGYKKLAEKIAEEMRRSDSSRRIDQKGVLAILREMAKRKLWSYPWTKGRDDHGNEMLKMDETRNRGYFNSIRMSPDDSVLYINTSLVFGQEEDPHEAAIKACMSAWTPKQSFLTGVPVDDQHPHMLRVRQAAKTKYIPLVKYIPIDEREAAATHNKYAVINMSYDEYSTRARLRQLGIPLHSRSVPMCNYATQDNLAKQQLGITKENTPRYPEARQRKTDAAMRKRKRLQTEAYSGGIGHMCRQYLRMRGTADEFLVNSVGYIDQPMSAVESVRQQLSQLDEDQLAAPAPLPPVDRFDAQPDASEAVTLQPVRQAATTVADSAKRRRLNSPTWRDSSRPRIVAEVSNGPGLSAADYFDDDHESMDERPPFFSHIKPSAMFSSSAMVDDDDDDDE